MKRSRNKSKERGMRGLECCAYDEAVVMVGCLLDFCLRLSLICAIACWRVNVLVLSLLFKSFSVNGRIEATGGNG